MIIPDTENFGEKLTVDDLYAYYLINPLLNDRWVLPKHFHELREQGKLLITTENHTKKLIPFVINRDLIGEFYNLTDDGTPSPPLVEDYQKGRTTELTKENEPKLMRMAVVEFFYQRSRSMNNEQLPEGPTMIIEMKSSPPCHRIKS